MYHKISGLNLIRFLLCCLLIISAGCASKSGGGVDIGSVVNANKQISKTVPVSSIDAYKAAVATLGQLNMPITAQYGDAKSMGMKSKFADNQVAWVDIRAINPTSCRITVSVDVFSDESRSRSLLESILGNVPNASAESGSYQTQVKQPDSPAVGSFNQPSQDRSTSEEYPEQLKPLPKEVVTEKSLM